MTTRTQGHEPWFTPAARTRIAEYLAEIVGNAGDVAGSLERDTGESRGDVAASEPALLAYALMPNHMHLVLRQGASPLGETLQPFLLRVAALVQRWHGVEGHVFERRYRAHLCSDPEYLRAVIVYAHLNPVRAAMVENPRDYRWSSHSDYLSARDTRGGMAPSLRIGDGLGLFAREEGGTRAAWRADYAAYFEWRLRCDRHRSAEARGESVGSRPVAPPVRGGDVHWESVFAPALRASGRDLRHRDRDEPLPLAEIARRVLAEHAPEMPLWLVRSAFKGRAVVRVRRVMIREMATAGYRGVAIAGYLGITQQAVSSSLQVAGSL